MSADYINKLRASFPQKTEAEIELMCSASRNLRLRTGISADDHRRRGMEKLFPSRVWHDWRDQRMKSVQYCLEHGIQELMWIGSSNSNKTADMADSALSLWWTKPEKTTIYVTSPYETATETGLWAYIVEQFEEAKANNPALPGKRRLSDNSIILYDKNPRSFIRVATVDQIGKLVGKKSKDFSEGLLVIFADELPAFLNIAARNFLSVTANLWSVPNLLIIGGGNFALTGDALGVFCDPDETEIPRGYDGFDPDVHFRWRTKRRGLVLRFDGLQSPNVKAGRDIYPFVTTIDYINKLAAAPGGLQSPDAMRYIRSAPVTSLDEFTVTNSDRIRAGGALEGFEWTSDTVKLGAFADPGFGGDACVIQKFKLGWMKTSGQRRQILALWGEPHTVPIRVGLEVGGVKVPVEDQIADGVKEHCEKHGIPPQHVGYDGSLRSGVVQKMMLRYSVRAVPLDSGGSATDRILNSAEKKTWREAVDRLLSELWFAAASLIDSFQLRGLELSPKAMKQLSDRRWTWSGKKKKVQTKQEYRDMLVAQGKPSESPNEADCLVGCVEMARRMGLSLAGVIVSGGSTQLLLQMIRERELKKELDFAKRISGLPAGRLHAMKPKPSPQRGRLHR